jgi:hypothetical protein
MIAKVCETCIHAVGVPGDERLRSCRRFPPVVYKVERTEDEKWSIASYNPIVDKGFWCGEWAANDIARSKIDQAVSSTGKRWSFR